MIQFGWGEDPVYRLAAGLYGSLTVITLCAVLADYNLARFIGFIGARSLYIFLAFFAPMAITRIALIKLGFVPEINVFAFLVTAVSVATPVLMYVVVRNTPLDFLIKRPEWFKLPAAKKSVPVT